MPFEQVEMPARKIAVVGAGISGMAAALLLSSRNRVVLLEAENRLGGHARTIIAGKNADQPVDTGFIVFNKVNYPNLTALFERMDVPIEKSDMSFGASFDGGRFEYSLSGLDQMFAQRRNLFDPRYLRMLRDILRFNKRALSVASNPDMTIRELISELRLGSWFRDRYLLPFSGAIWSTPKEEILDFPAQSMVRFFANHALLDYDGQHQWHTVKGGSVEYVRRLEVLIRNQGVDIRPGTPVAGVRRGNGWVELRTRGGEWERFDEVVFATHSDITLSLLSDASPTERAALAAIRYQPNEAVLHADVAMMPRRRKCWASWVYTEDAGKRSPRIDLTYWMNSLQSIPMDDPHFVTLNPTREIREELIYDTTTFHHPVYDVGALQAQKSLQAMQGMNQTWFCGAWMRDGFHEDGFASAVAVADAMMSRDLRGVAA